MKKNELRFKEGDFGYRFSCEKDEIPILIRFKIIGTFSVTWADYENCGYCGGTIENPERYYDVFKTPEEAYNAIAIKDVSGNEIKKNKRGKN